MPIIPFSQYQVQPVSRYSWIELNITMHSTSFVILVLSIIHTVEPHYSKYRHLIFNSDMDCNPVNGCIFGSAKSVCYMMSTIQGIVSISWSKWMEGKSGFLEMFVLPITDCWADPLQAHHIVWKPGHVGQKWNRGLKCTIQLLTLSIVIQCWSLLGIAYKKQCRRGVLIEAM